MEERQEEYNEVATEQYKVIIATYGVAAVGINLPRMSQLALHWNWKTCKSNTKYWKRY